MCLSFTFTFLRTYLDYNEFLCYNFFIWLGRRSPFDSPLCQIGEKFPCSDAKSHRLVMVNLSKIYQVARRLEFQFNDLKRERCSDTQIRSLIDHNVWLCCIKQFTSCLDPQNRRWKLAKQYDAYDPGKRNLKILEN